MSVLSTRFCTRASLISAVRPWAAVNFQAIVAEVGDPEFLDARLGAEWPHDVPVVIQ